MKVGIIGLGVGEAHIKGYESRSQVEVVSLCDFDPKKISMAREKYPDKKVTENAMDILEDPEIDVVTIASYDNFHFEQIIEAIKNNKHIFVEKPMCLYEAHAKTIRSHLRDKPHLKISSNLILRQCPRFQALKSRIELGEFGELFHVEGDYNYGRVQKILEGWRGKLDFYSATHGGGVHIIDLLCWLSGGRVEEVSAFSNNIVTRDSQFRFNDSITSILRFDSGMTGKVSVHLGCVRPHFHSLSLLGTKASFVNTPEHGLLFNVPGDDMKPVKLKEPYPGVEKGDLIGNFVDAIMRNEDPIVSQEDIFQVMSICFAIEQAQQQSGPVKIRYL